MTKTNETTEKTTEAEKDSQKKTVMRKGVVVSDKMEKTIVVEVMELKAHKKYHKKYKARKRYKVHDEENQAKTGDAVLFSECRPMSRDKKWKLVEIVK